MRVSQGQGPFATRTVFGWTVNGPLGRMGGAQPSANFIRADQELTQQFRMFCNWEFCDSIYDDTPAMSKEDCAARYDGVSLNSTLLRGPDLANNLIGVLSRFRQEPVAVMLDIEGMFHQVYVNPKSKDCDALRFLWWPGNDLNSDTAEHQMLVHLFGATSSPSCANFGLRHTADDNQDVFSKENRHCQAKFLCG